MSEGMFRQPTVGGGKYIKLDDYEGQLVLYRPESVDQVPAYKEPTKLVDEVTALWVAFGPTGHDEVVGAKFKGGTLVRNAKVALSDPEHPWVLGKLVKVATQETTKKFEIDYEPESFAKAREAWLRGGAKGEGPRHAWSLAEYTPEEAAKAAEYVASQARKGDPFAQPAAE